ncbi:hypothetical protein D6C76_05384 [Aureobasidium pullulans]|nr:hypothetical protein D6C76_05384 [Aureobasidium pullulans]
MVASETCCRIELGSLPCAKTSTSTWLNWDVSSRRWPKSSMLLAGRALLKQSDIFSGFRKGKQRDTTDFNEWSNFHTNSKATCLRTLSSRLPRTTTEGHKADPPPPASLPILRRSAAPLSTDQQSASPNANEEFFEDPQKKSYERKGRQETLSESNRAHPTPPRWQSPLKRTSSGGSALE